MEQASGEPGLRGSVVERLVATLFPVLEPVFRRLAVFRRPFNVLLLALAFIYFLLPTFRPEPDPSAFDSEDGRPLQDGAVPADPTHVSGPAGGAPVPPELKVKRQRLLLAKNPLNPDLHLAYIRLHRQLPRPGPVARLRAAYAVAATAGSPEVADLGHFGLGALAMQDLVPRGDSPNSWKTALAHFQEVSDSRLKWLNALQGTCLTMLGRFSEARDHFQREMEFHGASTTAAVGIAISHYREGDYGQALSLLNRPDVENAMPLEHLWGTYLHEWQWVRLLDVLVRSYRKKFSWTGLIGSIVILLVWFRFLRRIDLSQPEPLPPLILTFLLGIATVPLLFVLQDLLYFAWPLRNPVGKSLAEGWGELLSFYLFRVGFLEELVKILPLFLIWGLTDRLREPVDFMMYASISALGFAFEENLGYFSNPFAAEYFGRGFSTTGLHVCLSGIAAHGLITIRGQPNWKRLPRFGLTFVVAVYIHGLFDFCCKVGGSSIVMFLTFLLWRHFLVTSLKESKYFWTESLTGFSGLEVMLFKGFCWILLTDFVLKAWYAGPFEPFLQVLLVGPLAFMIPLVLGSILEPSPSPSPLPLPLPSPSPAPVSGPPVLRAPLMQEELSLFTSGMVKAPHFPHVLFVYELMLWMSAVISLFCLAANVGRFSGLELSEVVLTLPGMLFFLTILVGNLVGLHVIWTWLKQHRGGSVGIAPSWHQRSTTPFLAGDPAVSGPGHCQNGQNPGYSSNDLAEPETPPEKPVGKANHGDNQFLRGHLRTRIVFHAVCLVIAVMAIVLASQIIGSGLVTEVGSGLATGSSESDSPLPNFVSVPKIRTVAKSAPRSSGMKILLFGIFCILTLLPAACIARVARRWVLTPWSACMGLLLLAVVLARDLESFLPLNAYLLGAFLVLREFWLQPDHLEPSRLLAPTCPDAGGGDPPGRDGNRR